MSNDENKGARLSRQRETILDELRKVKTHPTADEVYDMVRKILPRISLGTVYRNLDFLSGRGVVLRLGGAGTQKRFDGNPAAHPHLRCSVCGRVDDLEWPLALPELPVEQSMGYSRLRCDVEFVGVCPMCAGRDS
ncbi:MAG: transcriptional repressor [Proteobacteria bacterium]|nr:transcriptional repressor [Pseudomonadota bacterium]MBU1595382.1 transcriptional repressor [Pseudomonadota bacterium]